MISFYGAKTLEKLEDNPYRLLAFTSFKKCDMIARGLGVGLDDPRRLTAVAQNVLYLELEQGNTVVPLPILNGQIVRFLGNSIDPGVAVSAGQAAKAIIVTEKSASLSGIRLLEMDVIGRIGGMLAPGGTAQISLFGGMDDIAAAISEFETETGYPLNAEQKAAITMAAAESLSVICGGAGVGKTTVLKVLVKALRFEIYLMALTGQAAQRITQATGQIATTIEYFLRHIADSLSASSSPLIVVDEASMLDLQLTARLLRALPVQARLVLVGDPAQLPPVNFGLIFHILAESARVPKVELIKINRQTEASGIPQISREVRVGTVPTLPAYSGPGGGVSFVCTGREEVIQKILDVKSDLPNAQILCVKNAGGLGIQDLNEVFHRVNCVGRKTEKVLGMSVGEPVIFKKNIADLDLVNGSLGTITDLTTDQHGEPQVHCAFSGVQKTIKGPHLEYLRLGYAVTVHSAQGSQFDHVIIVIEPSQILDRTLIYTALTRGIQQVVFIGESAAFANAIQAPPKATLRSVLFKI